MFRLIEENLVRQNKAMMLLSILLEEEYSRLQQSKPQSVSQIELSIQELMRQIAVERGQLRRYVAAVVPEAQRVRDLYLMLDEEKQAEFDKLLTLLDQTEQGCARQAAKNHEMALALYDQSKHLLDFMHNQIKPKNNTAYAAGGRYAQAANSARLLTGRV